MSKTSQFSTGKFNVIEDSRVHGVYALVGNLRVEVVRAYESDWRIFCRLSGAPCKHIEGMPEKYGTKSEALKDARRILKGDVGVEAWPKQDAEGAAPPPLDPFTRAYLECALWSSTDESDESGGEPLDKNYTLDDLAPEALERAIADCRSFQEANADDIYNADYAPGSGERSNAERAGHDFWLTRNGHGAGFWDRGLGEIGERLSKAAEAAGTCDAYLGDDGRIYLA